MNRTSPNRRLLAPIALALLASMATPARAVQTPADVRQAADAASAPYIEPTAVEGGMVPKLDVSKLSEPTRLCGWWDNPTPGNVSLTDKSGEWTIAMQGMYEAHGDGPDFKPGQQLPQGAPHGYGCACITARVDRTSRFVYSFTDAKALAPKVCRADPGLKKSGFK
jgi:Protein of unknown function (DUF4087)